jgi:acetyltransferase-like isoleucine patch superfamily enzyme
MRILYLIKRKLEFKAWQKKLKERNIKLLKPEAIMGYKCIEIEDNVYIGPGAYIMANGGLKIGKNVIIGPKFVVWTENHDYESKEMIPYDKGIISKPVLIEENVWIGLGVTLCPGVSIGEGSIIGMGSVVRGKIPPCSIVIGNPSVIVGKRNDKEYYLLKKRGKIFIWSDREF